MNIFRTAFMNRNNINLLVGRSLMYNFYTRDFYRSPYTAQFFAIASTFFSKNALKKIAVLADDNFFVAPKSYNTLANLADALAKSFSKQYLLDETYKGLFEEVNYETILKAPILTPFDVFIKIPTSEVLGAERLIAVPDYETLYKDDVLFFAYKEYNIIFTKESFAIYDNIGNQLEKVEQGLKDADWFTFRGIVRDEIPDRLGEPLIGILNRLELLELAKFISDIESCYPITVIKKPGCNYQDDITGDFCEGGILKDASGKTVIDYRGIPRECPVCGKSMYTGAGACVEISTIDAEGFNAFDIKDPVSKVTIDSESLTYATNIIATLKTEIVNQLISMPFSGLSQGSFSKLFEEQRANAFLDWQKHIIETFIKIMPESMFMAVNISAVAYEDKLKRIKLFPTIEDESKRNENINLYFEKAIISKEYLKLLANFEYCEAILRDQNKDYEKLSIEQLRTELLTISNKLN